jgi:hypothetical protein
MRTLFKICIWITGTGVSTLFAQDTAVYKREYQNKEIDTCTNKIVHHWVGCGHPEHYLQMCDGNILEKLEIFNRWGNRIYITTDQFNYIEPRDENGTILREGVYMYIIKYRTRSGELKTNTGQFTYIP